MKIIASICCAYWPTFFRERLESKAGHSRYIEIQLDGEAKRTQTKEINKQV